MDLRKRIRDSMSAQEAEEYDRRPNAPIELFRWAVSHVAPGTGGEVVLGYEDDLDAAILLVARAYEHPQRIICGEQPENGLTVIAQNGTYAIRRIRWLWIDAAHDPKP